jgi:hypothetical protein
MDSKMSQQEGTRMMYNPQTGGVGPVPYAKVEEALKDGLELTNHMYNPKTGGQGWIAQSKVEEAVADGLQNSGVPYPVSPYEQKIAQEQAAKAKSEETIGDKFSRTFLSGGANDVRNMAAAVTGGAAPQVANAIASGATQLYRAAPAITATGRAGYKAVVESPAAKLASQGASALGRGAMSVGKWLANTAGAGIAGYFGGKAAAEAEKAKQEILGP